MLIMGVGGRNLKLRGVDGSINNVSGVGELIAVARNPTGKQVIHTKVAREDPVADGDSSVRSS